MVYVICFLIGVFAAFSGSLIGFGGGIILIPTLLFLSKYYDPFMWATPQMIVGISLIVMVFTALSSTISYLKNGRVDSKTGLLFLIGSIPGSIVGSLLSQFFNTESFTLYFGMLMIVLSLLFLIKRKHTAIDTKKTNGLLRTFTIDGQTYTYHVSVLLAFFSSLFVGLLSGLFGLGGGSIMVPAMVILFGMPVHVATATSMFMIFFVSIISAGTHIVMGHVPWEHVFFFIPGAYFGGMLGARTNKHLKGKTLEWILRIILVIIGIRLILDGM